jgi:uncharacterized protein DUF2442
MLKPVEVKPLPGYKLWLKYAEGVEGEVDLSDLVGKGVFRLWDAPNAFENVSIGESGEIRWGEQVDLCADALFMQLTGKSPEDVFPNLKKAGVDA